MLLSVPNLKRKEFQMQLFVLLIDHDAPTIFWHPGEITITVDSLSKGSSKLNIQSNSAGKKLDNFEYVHISFFMWSKQ